MKHVFVCMFVCECVYVTLAELKPTYKKEDRCNKENYRPVSLLPVVSKIFENIIYAQISSYFDPILSLIQ